MQPDVAGLADPGQEVERIPVSINYDIIHLFSEGLYRSPHKAIEELVSNGYDAGARRVHVLLPEQPDGDATGSSAFLWVIDDGQGMDATGFRQLWRVADSNKAGPLPTGRAPIGQFGIGKLAAYVLAWKLTHVSRVEGRLLLTSMDFHQVVGRRQTHAADPVRVSLRDVDESTAKSLLADVERRDPAAWALMFDNAASRTWTAAGLTDFKELYDKLSPGRLRWVLSTGLPLHTDFEIRLNAESVASSKEELPEIKRIVLGSKDDTAAISLGLSTDFGGVQLPGIGVVSGSARICERQLNTGRSEQLGRSNGFFIRVRGRVINLEDELFGLEPLNHAAWRRFALEVDVDGLRNHLLSSREGVRDSNDIQRFREYLRGVFNVCRSAYEAWNRSMNEDLDIRQLLSDEPSGHVTEPLVHSVRKAVEAGEDSFYIKIPEEVEGITKETRATWLRGCEDEITKSPIDQTKFERHGPNAPAIRYDPATRILVINSDHPFVDKLTGGDKKRDPAKVFASSEVLLEGQLEDHGMGPVAVSDFLRDRDRTLRLTAGNAPPTAAAVMRWLGAAVRDPAALEQATGAAFQVLGFEYQRMGGTASGPDGILQARLGRHKKTLADYCLVYDAKQTDQQAVPADRIDLASLEEFRKRNRADFGFFMATAYAAEDDPAGALNRRLADDAFRFLTLLKVEHLRRLVWLHYRHGVTLTELRSLFEQAGPVSEVDAWLAGLEKRLQLSHIPVRDLLEALEREKHDPKAAPNVMTVRAKHAAFQEFEPERLVARLKAVEGIIGIRWIEVDDSRDVNLHQTATQILEELQRGIDGLAAQANEEVRKTA